MQKSYKKKALLSLIVSLSILFFLVIIFNWNLKLGSFDQKMDQLKTLRLPPSQSIYPDYIFISLIQKTSWVLVLISFGLFVWSGASLVKLKTYSLITGIITIANLIALSLIILLSIKL